MSDFSIIPVLDLKERHVVRGQAGKRETYRPIESPFGPADDPSEIARGLIEMVDAELLYIADLDAIEGAGSQIDIVRALHRELPAIEIWLDAGIADPDAAAGLAEIGATPVIGSESLQSVDQWTALQRSGCDLVLSLDFDAQGFRGPEALLTTPSLWPGKVIVMTLAKVGSGAGPDLGRLKELAAEARAGTAFYAAGGVRDIADMEEAADAGARGALVATVLHTQSLPQKEIAAFRRRRRFSNS